LIKEHDAIILLVACYFHQKCASGRKDAASFQENDLTLRKEEDAANASLACDGTLGFALVREIIYQSKMSFQYQQQKRKSVKNISEKDAL
jgi:hypothetical protein